MANDEDTIPTEEDDLLAQLRAEGILGPFEVSDWAGLTDVGQVRSNNEDRWDHVGANLFVVADGVGGNAGGERAAEIVAHGAVANGSALTESGAPALVAAINAAVVNAGDVEGLPKMAATMVLASLHENHMVIVSVGDSRIYRMRDGELELLTRDHNVKNELLASGVPLEAAKESRIRLDALTSFMGTRSDFAIPANVATHSIMAGDRILLSSDGVHDQVTAEQIRASLGLPKCQHAVEALIATANVAGGKDNATAIVFQLDRVER